MNSGEWQATSDEPSAALLAEGLTRLAGSLEGLPLLASRSAVGAFPATAPGKQSARFCVERGLVRFLMKAPAGKTEHFALTETGRGWLLENANSRETLKGLAVALEARSSQIAAVEGQLQSQQEQLVSLRLLIESCLDRLEEERQQQLSQLPPPGEADILAALRAWQDSKPLGDSPLPELFRLVRQRALNLSVGQFHDACRRLHERKRIYLHPWTGPLYEMPHPSLALMAGHEVAYYASLP